MAVDTTHFDIDGFIFPISGSSPPPPPPPPPSGNQAVSASNNGDGTVQVTIVTDSPESYALYYWQVPSFFLLPLPTLVGTGTTNANLTVNTGTGLYQFMSIDGNGSPSDVAPVLVTNGDPIAFRCREAIYSTILALALPNCQGVFRQWNPEDSNIVKPCVLLTVQDVSETDENYLATIDRIGYPTYVTIIDELSPTNQDPARLSMYEQWRQSIGMAFRRQRLFGVPESYLCKVEFDRISNPETPKYEHMVSEFVIRALCRTARGMGA